MLLLIISLIFVLLVNVQSKVSNVNVKVSVVDNRKKLIKTNDKINVIDDRQRQLINFFAGGLAGTISSLITAPLEVIKTQLQSSNSIGLIDVSSQIWKTSGINGFYRGVRPMLFGIIPTRAIYFWSYTTTKNALNSTSLGSSPLTHLLSAFSAGITSNTVTSPIWLVKTRFQLEQKKTYAEIIKTVYKEDGIKGNNYYRPLQLLLCNHHSIFFRIFQGAFCFLYRLF